MSHSIPWFLLFVMPIVIPKLALATTPKTMITASTTTKPGCQRKCGNLTIPYPFGIGYDCYLEYYFGVKCDTSYNPPKAFHLVFTNWNILDITDTEMLIPNPLIATKCYDSQGDETESPIPQPSIFETIGSPFTISHTANKFTVIGCDDYALTNNPAGTSIDKEEKRGKHSAGCFALCSEPDEATNGSCLGTGCCQVEVPIGLQMVSLELGNLKRRGLGSKLADVPCSSAFFAGDNFNFEGKTDLTNLRRLVNRTLEQVPLVLDWAVSTARSESCSQAKKNSTTYLCQSNTECVDSKAGGYNCRCLRGYEGNPYLEPGCTDVDECASKTSNLCSMDCTNTPGSYNCSCPPGYIGDGYTGCTKSQRQITIILALSISFGAILLILGSWWLYTIIKKRKILQQKAKNFKQNGGLLLKQQMTTDENAMERMKIFTADELERATDNFCEDRALGEGGQGTVYKGMLSDGRLVAIKKSKPTEDDSQLKQFINELIILTRINHRNIVMLLGSCLETEVPLIVYEFVPNGTLFNHIHNPSEEFPITWKMRLQIAYDSASALNYLHTSSSIPVFHRDMKSSNILLDDKYRAKLSDFGISKSVAIDQTHVTTGIMGTPGYLDPEYFQSNQYTEKSDVYSYGVVLVELLTGQKAIYTLLGEAKSLISWFLSHTENTRLLEIIDAQILKEGSNAEFLAIANIAVRCLNLDGKKRPSMREIQREIEAIKSTSANPDV